MCAASLAIPGGSLRSLPGVERRGALREGDSDQPWQGPQWRCLGGADGDPWRQPDGDAPESIRLVRTEDMAVRHRALDLLAPAAEEERSALDRVGRDQPCHPVGVEGAGEEVGTARDVVTRELGDSDGVGHRSSLPQRAYRAPSG